MYIIVENLGKESATSLLAEAGSNAPVDVCDVTERLQLS